MEHRDVVSVSLVDSSAGVGEEVGRLVDDAEAETIGVAGRSITLEDE